MPGRAWDAASEGVVRELATSGAPAGYAASQLGRSLKAVAHRAGLLGVRFVTEALPRWSPGDDAKLGAGVADNRAWADIARELGRTEAACKLRAYTCGFIIPHKRPWTPGDDERLRAAVARGESYSQVAADLGRTIHSVRQRVHRLGVSVRSRVSSGRDWTADEDAVLKAATGEGPTALSLRLPGRSRGAISCRRRELGLVRWTADPGLANRIHSDPVVLDRIRDLHREGLTVNAMVERLKPYRATPVELRRVVKRQLGLKLNPEPTEQRRERQRAILARLGAERARAREQEAIAHGLPPTLRPREVRVLAALAESRVAMTRKEIRQATGLFKVSLHNLDAGGLVTTLREGRRVRYTLTEQTARSMAESPVGRAKREPVVGTPQERRDIEAAGYGLPPGLQAFEVRAVLALAGGSMTRQELARAIGTRGPTGLRMGRLQSLNLVTTEFYGALPSRFSLTPHALERLGTARVVGGAA